MKLASVQLSVAVGAVQVTTFEQLAAVVLTVIPVGHPVITGGVVSVAVAQHMVPPFKLSAAATEKLPTASPGATVVPHMVLIVALRNPLTNIVTATPPNFCEGTVLENVIVLPGLTTPEKTCEVPANSYAVIVLATDPLNTRERLERPPLQAAQLLTGGQ